MLALAFGLWAGLTVRPLSRLREGAQRVARGDFATVDVRTGDEIGQLAEEFNVMAASLAHRDHLLKRQGEELMRNERLATIGQMSSQITHEIRNPLASMGLNTELLEDELTDLVSRLGDTDQLDEVRQLVNAIRGEVDRLTDVTDQYLRFARLSAPTREPTDLNGLIRSLLDFSSAELSQRRVTVTTNLSETLGEVSLDADQIRQCVLNLVRNAMEAMPDGGKLTVTTRRDEENHAQLTIADTGEGMDDTTIARIYEPFFSTKTTGTGLGLPLVQEIIREHEGELLVESRTGAGTTFTVRLPG